MIVLPPSSFVADTRSAYDGAIGGTLANSYIAIPGDLATPNRAFWFTQTDGVAQRGQNPGNWDPALAAYTMVQVPLGPGMVTAADVAAALELAMSAFGTDYTVVQIGPSPTASWIMRVTGDILAASAFTGPSFAARGVAGLWGTRITDLDQFGSYGQGPLAFCAAQYLQAPALAGLRLVAMDVFIGSLHDPTSQFRIAVYEGGDTVDPTGAVLLYDFGETFGVAPTTWFRLWVDPEDMVMVGSAVNLWNVTKSDGGPTNIGGVFTGSSGEGNFLDQDFWQSTSMNNDPTVPFEAVFSAGGMHGSTFILATRLIFETAPYLGDGSWARRYGNHVSVAVASNSDPFNGSLLMSGIPPQVLGMELTELWVPYGNVHQAGNQFRVGLAQSGVDIDTPNGAELVADLGQTTGAVTNDYVVMTAPPPGISAIAIDPAEEIRWWVKSDDAGGSHIAYANAGGGLSAMSPFDNPMDWTENGVNTNPEYDMFPPTANTDPTVPFEALVPATTVPPDARNGNYLFGVLTLRVNGILVFPG